MALIRGARSIARPGITVVPMKVLQAIQLDMASADRSRCPIFVRKPWSRTELSLLAQATEGSFSVVGDP